MTSPEISVVIPSYRGGSLLAEAIESVLVQSFQDFEIVLVDNNADPETKAIILRYMKEYPNRIRVFLETEQGVCSARNRGILESYGNYIALLDDDDMMTPDRLEKQRRAAIKEPDASMVVCRANYLDGKTGEILESSVIDQRGGKKEWKEMECLIQQAVEANSSRRTKGVR